MTRLKAWLAKLGAALFLAGWWAGRSGERARWEARVTATADAADQVNFAAVGWWYR